MKRTTYPGAHSGQISFPGGKKDNIDNSILETALRETEEEVGIKTNNIEYLGNLTPINIPVTGFHVYPYIGYIKSTPIFNTDPKEVDFLIEAEINQFLSAKTWKSEYQEHGQQKGIVPFFDINNNKIWGATAMILSEFLVIWKELYHKN